MPTIRVEWFEGRTQAQKAELARAITEAVVTIANTTPEAVNIILTDIPKSNWAHAGKLMEPVKAE
ncbi:MAG: tautomerase family protein [Dehalococcoidia bacterium]